MRSSGGGGRSLRLSFRFACRDARKVYQIFASYCWPKASGHELPDGIAIEEYPDMMEKEMV
jgi:hypothetical protein